VKPIGALWEQIKEKCIRGRLQPSILFYERNYQSDENEFQFEMEIFKSNSSSNVTSNNSNLTSVNSNSNITSNNSNITSNNSNLTSVNSNTDSIGKLEVENDDMNIEKSMTSSLFESFILIPRSSDIDFPVLRTNWYYSKQKRILRCLPDYFLRVEPNNTENGVTKDTFYYQDIFEVVQTSPSSIIINFFSERTAQYLECDVELMELLLKQLIARALLKKHEFKITKNY